MTLEEYQTLIDLLKMAQQDLDKKRLKSVITPTIEREFIEICGEIYHANTPYYNLSCNGDEE